MTVLPAIYRHYVTNRLELPLRTRIACTFAAVALLHVTALCLLATSWVAGAPALATGTVLTAYLAGLKHSYDWDHVAAIDNSVRKFVNEGGNPASVGFAFSLGHSTVVTLAGALVVAGAHVMQGAFAEGSAANHVLGLIGMGVSGGYLLLLGCFNAAVALRLWRALRSGPLPRGHQHDLGQTGGLVARLLARPLRRVRRPRDVFVIGFLFGLGFDTATTIGLLVLTVGASLAGVPPLALLGLPVAFTAAMTLCDSINGMGMMHLYRSAALGAGRRIRFNALVTTVSAVSALFIATITLGGFAHELLGLQDPVTSYLAEVDLGDAGLGLVAVFALLWLGHRLLGRVTRSAAGESRGTEGVNRAD